MSISPELVMQLRRDTGAGVMECKKALVESQGDIDAATKFLRKAGQAKAENKSHRIAAEGIVIVKFSEDKRSAVIMEINSETDFVARDQSFMHFAEIAANVALLHADIHDLGALAAAKLPNSEKTLDTARLELIAKSGENIQIRRFERLSSDQMVGGYSHGTNIGVLVSLTKQDEELAKDLAMHIAASRPQVIRPNQVSQEAIDYEKAIFTDQAMKSGKPQEIIDKMIEGRLNEFVNKIALIGQPFVKDPNKKISQLLKDKNAEVCHFIRYEVGEGMQKKADNFVEEVMAQVRD